MIFSIFEYDLGLGELIILLLAITAIFMVSLAFREYSQGFVAYKLGDGTPKASGRLTLNPMAHVDTTGFIMFLCLGIGWAKPMPINPTNFKKYRSGIAKVSLAGLGGNLILCIIGSFLYVLSAKFIGDGNDLFVIISFWLMWVNACLFIFHLLPIYPLDGFVLISSFMRSDNSFVQGNIRYAGRIFLWILIIDLVADLFFGVSIIGYILTKLAGYICTPLCKLWQLMF